MSDSELNGNVTEGNTIDCSKASSMEDLSEYTDADQSISAPTEILAEFLSSIMMKDYEKALKYCALILHYEPNNSTAREFYPLIEEKLEMIRHDDLDDSDSVNSIDSSSTSSSSSFENDSDGTTASYSSLEDDEAGVENSDITNGNTSHINTGISSNLNQENKSIGLDEKKVTEAKSHLTVQNKTSPKKWVHSASPTKRDISGDLTRTRTHTKHFQTHLDNESSLTNPQLSIKSSKISGSNNSNNSHRNKISDTDK